jgi:hypothetical protein
MPRQPTTVKRDVVARSGTEWDTIRSLILSFWDRVDLSQPKTLEQVFLDIRRLAGGYETKHLTLNDVWCSLRWAKDVVLPQVERPWSYVPTGSELVARRKVGSMDANPGRADADTGGDRGHEAEAAGRAGGEGDAEGIAFIECPAGECEPDPQDEGWSGVD